VDVSTLNGERFIVTVDEAQNRVADLKSIIEDQEGISVCRQQLFVLDGTSNEDSSGTPLRDSDTLEQSCSVVLYIMATTFKWDDASPLITREGMFTAGCGHDGNVIRSVKNGIGNYSMDADYKNCLMLTPTMHGTGTYTVSLELIRISYSTSFGLVTSTTRYDEAPDESFFIDLENAETGNNMVLVDNNFGFKVFKPGDIITMQADLDTGTLRIWLDGEPYACANIPQNCSYRWGLNAGWSGESAKIIHPPTLGEWPEIKRRLSHYGSLEKS
jgi:hypothetical protein